MDVQTPRRIGMGLPYEANGCLLVRGYRVFRMKFTSSYFTVIGLTIYLGVCFKVALSDHAILERQEYYPDH
jgi:hypothetical protein